ncbi:hypothetical protein NQ314_005736 [Rhamnusium bicolor]|uniref:Uncharacterized protein n=1 Tax=Rhamnusium bicolor TaxID=1586634 RepID=A0AAV8ZEK4_9CUCU|nr:hypothetical protein NQ314_005736 [Rhamnusium bicolor]
MVDKKKVYSVRELEQLTSSDFYNLIDEIPSDNESELGDVSDNEEDEEAISANKGDNDLFDLMNLPVDILDVVDVVEDNDVWDGGDDIPLSVIRHTEFGKKKQFGQNLLRIA